MERTKLAAGSPEVAGVAQEAGQAMSRWGRLRNERFLATIEPWHGNVVAVYTQRRTASGGGM